MREMRVLQICSYYSSALYALLFDRLRAKGVEQDVYYFAVKGTEYSGPTERVTFSPCYGQADRLFFSYKEKKVLKDLYSKINPDGYVLTHAHSLFSNGYVARDIKRRHGVPYVVAVRNSDVNAFLRKRPWLRGAGLDIMLESEKVVFVSPAYRARVLDEFVPDEYKEEIASKSTVIPNGISGVFLDNVPKSPRVSDGVIRVVQVGDINRNKNSLATARACELLLGEGKKVALKVIGRPFDGSILKKLSAYPFVEVLPPMSQNDLVSQYRGSDVFVMPSKCETFGLVYAEAMSQGLPIVYTRGQGFDGFFEDGQVGKAVKSDDIGGIASSIKGCYRRRKEMFSSCIRAARAFDWDSISDRYCQLYAVARC